MCGCFLYQVNNDKINKQKTMIRRHRKETKKIAHDNEYIMTAKNAAVFMHLNLISNL